MLQQEAKIVLLHTNDIHSSFQTMPLVAGTVARLRRRHEDIPVLFADCGDHLDRMHPITEASDGEAHLEIMEAMGYDFITLGNNEGLTFTRERLEELFTKHRGFEVIAANLKEQATGAPPRWMKPSHIWEQDGIRIGFIGATAAYSIFYNLLGWQVDEPYEAIRREAALLKGRVDAVVVLSHLGLRWDKRLAEEVEGIDLILGGHTHHVLEPPLRHGGALLCCCGSLGRYVGEVELYFAGEPRKLVRIEGRIHSTEQEREDPALKRLIQDHADLAEAGMSQRVALLERHLPIDWERDSPLGNLLAAGIRKQTGAEIGVINSGQLLTSLMPGAVTRGALLEMCPSPVNPCLIRLQGSHLMLALEESLLEEFVHMPLFGNGFRGKHLGGLCVDGLLVIWNPAGKPYNKIREIRVGGEQFDPKRDYLVGTADMFTFGTGYLSLKEGREARYFLPGFLRHTLEAELNDAAALEKSFHPRFYEQS
ncbi:MAG: metallophosphoesterase [Paenibacillaceae bacterium]|jgi:2',3'-cyclic-nucleotide 2'-phosphodiesterase (5'-nucleotidase family)|nr:metallophosphoesterase [Paenibacillaceae bacterium]